MSLASALKHEVCVLDKTGDYKIIFDPNNESEVEEARQSFTRMKAKGHIAYKVLPGGDKGEILREFDPAARKIIMAPPMQGG